MFFPHFYALQFSARCEYSSAVTNNVDEAKKLIEAGFEYVCNQRARYASAEPRLTCPPP
jgi:hypothetical protein